MIGIPNSCISFYERAMCLNDMVIEEYEDLQNEIALYELVYYHTMGYVPMYELDESASNELRSKYVASLQRINNKIESNYSQIIKHFKDSLASKKDLKEIGADKISYIEKPIAVTHTFFNFDKVSFAENGKSMINTIVSTFSKNQSELQSRNDIRNALVSDICSTISGVSSITSIKGLKNTLKMELIGSEVKVDNAFLKKYYQKINSVVLDSTVLDYINKCRYNENKLMRYTTNTIRSIGNNKNLSAAINDLFNLFIITLNVTHLCYGSLFDVCNRMIREYTNIVTKVNKYGSKNEGDITSLRKSIAMKKNNIQGNYIKQAIQRNQQHQMQSAVEKQQKENKSEIKDNKGLLINNKEQ